MNVNKTRHELLSFLMQVCVSAVKNQELLRCVQHQINIESLENIAMFR